jgi:8-oxo-dGTP diphosphatase
VAHRDGDGWVECLCGNRHWGLNGAAGLLLVRDNSILMQHRAPWVHNGDTWGIPGGARDSHETAIEAALREAEEEIGIHTNLVDPIETYIDEHNGWSYDTVISIAHKDLIAHEQNDESLQVEWVAFDDVVAKNLHPSFAKTWPTLLARLKIIFI